LHLKVDKFIALKTEKQTQTSRNTQTFIRSLQKRFMRKYIKKMN